MPDVYIHICKIKFINNMRHNIIITPKQYKSPKQKSNGLSDEDSSTITIGASTKSKTKSKTNADATDEDEEEFDDHQRNMASNKSNASIVRLETNGTLKCVRAKQLCDEGHVDFNIVYYINKNTPTSDIN